MVAKGAMLDMTKTQLVAALVASFSDDPAGWEHFFRGMTREQLRASLTKRQDYLAKRSAS